MLDRDRVQLLRFDQLGDALRLVPRAIILKPEKYKELLDQIEQLKAMARPNRAVPPSSCSLKGKIEGNTISGQMGMMGRNSDFTGAKTPKE